ncbi:hypothetical protein [Corynebacterium pseudopelargi]|uniref:hypothetical protein n=1 Tax=Corynebacterium pseudopelargi TaxID=2080757 RepID=UPI000F4EC544|nr:hypothetical protein [Corynebacterium pseudopelargi]
MSQWLEVLGIPATEDNVEEQWEALTDRISDLRLELQESYTQKWEQYHPGQELFDNGEEWMAMHERVMRQAKELAANEMFLEPIRIKRMQEMD